MFHNVWFFCNGQRKKKKKKRKRLNSVCNCRFVSGSPALNKKSAFFFRINHEIIHFYKNRNFLARKKKKTLNQFPFISKTSFFFFFCKEKRHLLVQFSLKLTKKKIIYFLIFLCYYLNNAIKK